MGNTNSSYILTKSDDTKQAIPDLIPSKKSIGAIKDYPIYGSAEEMKLISKIDAYVNSIKRNDGKCELYEAAKQRMNEKNTQKMDALSTDLKQSELCILTKYECKELLLKNEFDELMKNAKNELIAKYESKRFKQAKLFKNEFARQHRKYKKSQKQKNDEIDFKMKRYQRPKLFVDGQRRSNKERWPHFFNDVMQKKWAQINGISEDLMESDVNDMMMRNDECLNIIDILSMFPQCDVVYKSDANILQIGTLQGGKEQISLKIGSFIGCCYKRQSVMLGYVQSISSKSLSCNLRQRGDKYAKYELINLKIKDIETGKVKIKLIH